jgi:hypothetical protein
MKIIILFLYGSLLATSAFSQGPDIYGYFEPQYSVMTYDETYYNFQSNKLRLDLQKYVGSNTKLKCDFIHILYTGKTDWNVLDFLPARISSSISPELQPAFQFNYSDSFYLDNVYARYSVTRFSITIGKQQISLGTGYFSNPTDIFNTKDVLDPTYEQPGHNGIRLDFLLKNRLQIMVLYAPIKDTWYHSGKLARLKYGVEHFDFAFIYNNLNFESTDFFTFQTSSQRRNLYGLNFVGELFGIGVWGEGAYNWMKEEDDFHEYLLGGDYTFENGFYALMEYHYNSWGKSNQNEYDLNDWMRFFSGETKTICREQIYGAVRYPIGDFMSVGSSVVGSISDGSIGIIPSFDYNVFENVDISVIMNYYVGKEGTVYSSTLGNGGLLRVRVYF